MPEPGAFEVIVRVMAAGVNYNNVWAALGKPVSVMALRRPPGVRPPHRRLGRVGRGLEGRRGRDALEARRRGGHPLQHGLLRGPRGARPRPARRAEPEDLGLRDHLGLVRPVHQGPGAAAAAEAAGPHLGRGVLVRPRLLHGLPHADHPLQHPGGRPRADLGRRRRARRVRHADLRDGRRPRRRRRVERRQGRAREAARRGGLHRPQRVQGHDAHRRRDGRRGEGALQGLARVLEAREADPRRRSRHRLRARRARPPSPPRCSPSSRSARS